MNLGHERQWSVTQLFTHWLLIAALCSCNLFPNSGWVSTIYTLRYERDIIDDIFISFFGSLQPVWFHLSVSGVTLPLYDWVTGPARKLFFKVPFITYSKKHWGYSFSLDHSPDIGHRWGTYFYARY